ncbi:DUF488 domain-containing protein [Allosalinactinospora lopnorensis]|uniref:DUF488 domain-containing protein n=1 Tax=Allosalinactinospora lopnorensis TaxID=1352348 RepID=UPI001569927C|nr:DUF488 domain-containing protein [Allosalinactinospora lopnorensis]
MQSHTSAAVLVTFGHGTAEQDTIADLLRGAGMRAVVDVRIAPGSRRNPHVARSELERWLPELGIRYRWDKRLGGRRRPSPDSPDVAWRVEGFRGYAEHMRTPDFLAAAEELLGQAAAQPTAILCSESVWWRCHRRLIADFAQVTRHTPVRHLMHDGRMAPHEPGPGVRPRDDGLLVYDAGGQALL